MERHISFDENSKSEALNMVIGFCKGYSDTALSFAEGCKGSCPALAEVYEAKAEAATMIRNFILECMGEKKNEWNV